MNRFITITEAKKLCPNLIMQHVATWKEGDEKWAYHEDAFEHIATHKVSLDPYRLESRRIFACIKDVLPAPPIQRVEKASVDEVFLDLSAQVHSIMLERYPEISGPAPYDDPTENLPRPPTTALEWNTDALVDLDDTETEDDDPDWDDIAMLIGSEIVRSVRAAICERLKYTCSAGVAHNKMIAKLGSGHKKPNQQTIVRNRAVQQFLGGFKFTKIRNLGGKLGDQIVSTFGTDQVTELLQVPIEQLKSKLGDDTGSWVYQIIRGEEYSEVNSRTQIKSMLSAKSFRPSINTFEQAVRWLRIFVADIFSRLVEEGVLENKRRPKTINLHHRQGGQMRSRQAAIPTGTAIDERLLFDLAKNVLGQIVVDGRAWPCANLSLSVGGFEEGLTGNRGIGGFLLRGDEAKALRPASREIENQAMATSPQIEDGRPEKRRKLDNEGIQKFFPKREISRDEQDEEFGADQTAQNAEIRHLTRNEDIVLHDIHETNIQIESCTGEGTSTNSRETSPQPNLQPTSSLSHSPASNEEPPRLRQSSSENYFCGKCAISVPTSSRSEHEDWHFAKDLQAQDRTTSTSHSTPSITSNPASTVLPLGNKANNHPTKRGPKKPGGGSVTSAGIGPNVEGKVEKGQKRLVFGR